ncbi:MAG: hypothetical protein KC475_06155 [Cyanobacteria bacterium HKST-UBA03]|nr:hypothetical protein [Cyanobacteria bacterium HKST-UBA05]MCA9841686.1 hypothetical protein [Cyanobacteria bacterium HKST-UBA03]
MSFAPNVGYLLLYTARQSDLEFQQNLIINNLQQLIAIGTRIISVAASTDPLSPDQARVAALTAAVQQQEKALRLTLARLQSEYQVVTKMIDSIRKLITKNVEMSFKTFG